MIIIKNLEHAKKLTASLFRALNKQKYNLNSFRKKFAGDCGYTSLEDAFHNENEERLNKAKSNVITYLDDPRITIEVARKIGEDEEVAETYFNEHLKETSQDILFPIKNSFELLKRCEEILILWHEAEWFSRSNYVNLIIKMALPQDRIRYEFMGRENANPELLLALKLIGKDKSRSSRGSIISLITREIEFYEDNQTPEDGFYNLTNQVRLFVGGIIWTQTNVGRSYHSDTIDDMNDIDKRNSVRTFEENEHKKSNKVIT